MITLIDVLRFHELPIQKFGGSLGISVVEFKKI